MIVVMPDARYAGAAEIEQAVFGDRATIKPFQAPTQADISDEVWESADALMVWGRLRCDKEMLDRAKNVKMILRMGVGFDALDIEEAGKRGIPACNVPDYGTTDVADHAIGLHASAEGRRPPARLTAAPKISRDSQSANERPPPRGGPRTSGRAWACVAAPSDAYSTPNGPVSAASTPPSGWPAHVR